MKESSKQPAGAPWQQIANAQDEALRNRMNFSGIAAAVVTTVTEQTSKQSPWRRRFIVMAALPAAAALAVLVYGDRSQPLQFGMDGKRSGGSPGVSFVAPKDRALLLSFSDDSSVRLEAGTQGRVQSLTDSGAAIVVEQGELQVHVVHTATTTWRVHAGPFVIRVTGTRFRASWQPSTQTFAVAMQEGEVEVEGPTRVGSKRLRGQENWQVRVLADPVATVATAAPTPQAPPVRPPAKTSERPVRRIAPTEISWQQWAEKREFPRAWQTAQTVGIEGLCATLEVKELLELGDVARYARDSAGAQTVFASLVARFPEHPLAADAVFTLGRIAFDQAQYQEAARWFGRYATQWPHGPLAQEALTRWSEASTSVPQLPPKP